MTNMRLNIMIDLVYWFTDCAAIGKHDFNGLTNGKCLDCVPRKIINYELLQCRRSREYVVSLKWRSRLVF